MQRITGLVAAALLLSISGCSYYSDDDDDGDAPLDDGVSDDGVGDDGARDPDAGVVDPGPDGAAVCDPAAILPQNFQPVAAVSTGTVVNLPDPDREGAFLTTVDASAGGQQSATQPFLYLDLDAEEGARAVAIDDVASFDSTEWDIALKRFVIRSNSGDSGPADEEVASVEGEELRAEDSVPSATFADDDWSGADCSLITDERGGPRTRFSNWYQVETGSFNPRPLLHVVRLGQGRYAEIDITTYYGDQANPSRGGVYVLRWRRFP
jgi:hypothetical protein